MKITSVSQPEPAAGLSSSQLLVTKAVFAQLLSVSVRTVDTWIALKKIPFIRLSRKIVRIPLPEARDHITKTYCVKSRD